MSCRGCDFESRQLPQQSRDAFGYQGSLARLQIDNPYNRVKDWIDGLQYGYDEFGDRIQGGGGGRGGGGCHGGMLGWKAIIHPCGRWMESVEERATYGFVSLALQKIEDKV